MLQRQFQQLFPVACVMCGLPAGQHRICDLCQEVLPWNDCVCECCGQPVTTAQPAGISCAACQRRTPCFDRARAPLRYSFPVDAALKQMKFRRQLTFAPAFAEILLGVLLAEFAECDALVPVPLHRWRHVTRGFNQALELARPLAKKTGLPIIQTVTRNRATSSQTGLSAAARRTNLEDAFVVHGDLQYRHPLIIDDVITTGATCNQLAKSLLAAGAKNVGVLAVAHSSQL